LNPFFWDFFARAGVFQDVTTPLKTAQVRHKPKSVSRLSNFRRRVAIFVFFNNSIGIT